MSSKYSKKEYSPYVGRDFPTRVFWGDTHLHTAVSVDAGTMCRLGKEEAFRFARGEEVVTTGGLRALREGAPDRERQGGSQCLA